MAKPRLYPMLFEPVFRDYIWGGRHLETEFGRELPPGIVAESWEISGHVSSPTAVASGAWEGKLLPDVMAELGVDLVGTNGQEMLDRGKFPLLVKLLDANRPLSVQVHPDDAYAIAKEGGELGKTEMWYVLWAEEGAEIVYGLQPGVTRESFAAALASEPGSPVSLETQLHREPIRPGDCAFVPAGTVHALLEGAVVAEVQQNSDTTYRVYDWGRLGADGKPRELHVNKALEVIDWDCVEPHVATPEPLDAPDGVVREGLVRCEQFISERVALQPGAAFGGICDGATFEIWGLLKGTGEICWQKGRSASDAPVALEAVQFALLPAALGAFSVTSAQESVWLRTTIP